MNAHPEIVPSLVDHIKQTLVGLKMPRAIEILDVTVRRLERGEMTAIEAIDVLLAEEFTLRENRRIKIALMMARLSTIKTFAGFDFSFQPSLDKNRIMALAEGWSSSIAVKSYTSSARLEPARAICRWRSACRPSKPDAASTSTPTSYPRARSPRPSARAPCARRSSSSAVSPSSSSMRSATCRSFPAAAICSSNSSMPATKRAP